jgi:hypothetical protein
MPVDFDIFKTASLTGDIAWQMRKASNCCIRSGYAAVTAVDSLTREFTLRL